MKSVNLVPLLVAAGFPEPVAEHQFHPERRWRWDLAWKSYLVALERQGSTWTAGRHTRGAGYRNDAIKFAEGQILGWLVVSVTADMLEDGTAFDLLERALQSRGWEGKLPAAPDSATEVLQCGCPAFGPSLRSDAKSVMKGWRCPVHGAP